MEIKTTYKFWDVVYIKTDVEQLPGMVIGMVVIPKNIRYIVNRCGDETTHYEQELSTYPNYVIKVGDN